MSHAIRIGVFALDTRRALPSALTGGDPVAPLNASRDSDPTHYLCRMHAANRTARQGSA